MHHEALVEGNRPLTLASMAASVAMLALDMIRSAAFSLLRELSLYAGYGCGCLL